MGSSPIFPTHQSVCSTPCLSTQITRINAILINVTRPRSGTHLQNMTQYWSCGGHLVPFVMPCYRQVQFKTQRPGPGLNLVCHPPLTSIPLNFTGNMAIIECSESNLLFTFALFITWAAFRSNDPQLTGLLWRSICQDAFYWPHYSICPVQSSF